MRQLPRLTIQPELEVMGHETTDPSCITLVLDRSKAHGFLPFHVKTPSMGYLYNRWVVNYPYLAHGVTFFFFFFFSFSSKNYG